MVAGAFAEEKAESPVDERGFYGGFRGIGYGGLGYGGYGGLGYGGYGYGGYGYGLGGYYGSGFGYGGLGYLGYRPHYGSSSYSYSHRRHHGLGYREGENSEAEKTENV